MNRNSIRTKVKVATCCLATAVVLSGSSFVSNAALNVGTGSFASSMQTEASTENNTAKDASSNTMASAGVSLTLARYASVPPEENSGEEDRKSVL